MYVYMYWDVHLTKVPLSDQSYGFQGNLTDVDVSFLVKTQSPKSDSKIIEMWSIHLIPETDVQNKNIILYQPDIMEIYQSNGWLLILSELDNHNIWCLSAFSLGPL